MLIVVPRIEQDIDATALGQVRGDLVQHLFDLGGEFVKGEFRCARAGAIELLDQFAREIELPRQHELYGTELQSEGHIARAVGEFSFLAPRLTMIVVQRNRFEGAGCHIFGTESIVDPQKEQAPAGALLNLADDVQEKQGQRFLDRRTVPGTGAEKIGECEFVGMGQPQQARERAQGLVLAGTHQEGFDPIEGMVKLGRRKADEQGSQKVA